MVELNDANFDEMTQLEQPVLVDFWAPWCGPCRMMNPVIEELSQEYDAADSAIVAKLNVDDNPETPSKFGVLSIPAILIFKKGVLVERMSGVRSKEEIKARLNIWV